MNNIDQTSRMLGQMEGDFRAVFKRLDDIVARIEAMEEKIDKLHSDRNFARGWLAAAALLAGALGAKIIALLGLLK